MISALDERADALKEGAEMFEKQAGALKSKFWYENMKMLAIMALVALIFILVFFVWVSALTTRVAEETQLNISHWANRCHSSSLS